MVNDNLIWDVIVIGGGVVGCAVHRKFTLMGAKVLLLEKGGDILSGASKANSAIMHTGFDATPDSIELYCMQKGYKEFMQIHEKMNLPVLKTGALVVAWNQEQLTALPEIVQKAHKNNVTNVTQISVAELYVLEPNLAKGALGAVFVPDEFVIDPWSTPLAYLTQAIIHGSSYKFNCKVESGEFNHKIWQLNTSQGVFKAKLVINCTGIYGDIVEAICRKPKFMIKPRKGQFIVYDKIASKDINSIILPVPTATTKGVLLCKTIFGNVIVGPTAEEQEDRSKVEVNQEMLNSLIQQGLKILPSIKNYSITATYAGLRPASEEKDYRIYSYPQKNWLCAGAIRSTGLTSALGVAQYLAELYLTKFEQSIHFQPPKDLIWPKMPNLAEHLERGYKKRDNGGIVCHCELVTRKELEDAFDSAIPPECIGGLRRRTRVMMGRCNGFYCSSNVNKIIKDRIKVKLNVEDSL